MGEGVTVDTADVDEGLQRLTRAVESLARAGDGLDGLGGASGLAVGADALLDALGDLARTWRSCLDLLEDEATSLRLAVGAARERYDGTEHDVLSMVLDSGIDTSGRSPGTGTGTGTGTAKAPGR